MSRICGHAKCVPITIRRCDDQSLCLDVHDPERKEAHPVTLITQAIFDLVLNGGLVEGCLDQHHWHLLVAGHRVRYRFDPRYNVIGDDVSRVPVVIDSIDLREKTIAGPGLFTRPLACEACGTDGADVADDGWICCPTCRPEARPERARYHWLTGHRLKAGLVQPLQWRNVLAALDEAHTVITNLDEPIPPDLQREFEALDRRTWSDGFGH